MRPPRRALGAAVAAAALLLAGCGATAGNSDSADSESASVPEGAQYMVPNSPGGGYDTTARVAAKTMGDEKIASGLQVFNLEGAGGTVGLQRVLNERGNDKLIMQMGLGVVGASYTAETQARLTETTAVARMLEEAGAIVVAADSPYKDIDGLVTAWKKDPAKFPVGGGSNPGGPDHLMPMQFAKAVGVDPTKVNYVSYDGGGELLPAVLSEQVSFGASGFGEFLDQVEAGDLRVLAVTSAQRVPVLPDVPTLKESGVDMEFTNWRGVVAPPGITPEQRQAWIDAFTKLNESPAWRQELTNRGWTEAFITGDEYATFLADQDKMVADTLSELGLT